MTATAVRPPVLAGTWYPGDPETLAMMVDGFLGAGPATPPLPGKPAVLLVPHAGYAYSGPVAGRGYRTVRGRRYRRVVILAPNHRVAISRIALPSAAAYETPLGRVPLDSDALAALAGSPAFTVSDAAHGPEHAVEIQLPFLQRVLDPLPPVVPLLVPSAGPELRREAAAALADWTDGRTLWVVSSDMTHFGPAYGYVPFTDRIPERIAALDRGALERIAAWDADGLVEYGRRTGITMCGLAAMALAMSAPWPVRPRVVELGYARSGDQEGDYTLSVSYAAAAACLPGETGGEV